MALGSATVAWKWQLSADHTASLADVKCLTTTCVGSGSTTDHTGSIRGSNVDAE